MSMSEIEDRFREAEAVADARILEIEEERAHLQARLADLTNELWTLKAAVDGLNTYLNDFFPVAPTDISFE